MSTLATLPTLAPSEIFAVLGIAGVILGFILWALDTIYVRKKAFHEARAKDREIFQASVADAERKRQEMQALITKQAQEFALFTSGPVNQLTTTLDNLQVALASLNSQQERRQEKLMDTLIGFDHRLTIVETRTGGASDRPFASRPS